MAIQPDIGSSGQRGTQFGADPNFMRGTIGGPYASWCANVGADVAVWDTFAPEASFTLPGVRRCFELSDLVKDTDNFAPMLPLKNDTRGLVGSQSIRVLPRQSHVVLVTRAAICDTETLYQRVLNDELALAADVWDVEPVRLDSPPLGRHNVSTHTTQRAPKMRITHGQMMQSLGFHRTSDSRYSIRNMILRKKCSCPNQALKNAQT